MRKCVITSFMSTGDAKPNLKETYLVFLKSGKSYICDYEMYSEWFWQKKKPVFSSRYGTGGDWVFFDHEVAAFISIYEITNYMADAVEKFNELNGDNKSNKAN